MRDWDDSYGTMKVRKSWGDWGEEDVGLGK